MTLVSVKRIRKLLNEDQLTSNRESGTTFAYGSAEETFIVSMIDK